MHCGGMFPHMHRIWGVVCVHKPFSTEMSPVLVHSFVGYNNTLAAPYSKIRSGCLFTIVLSLPLIYYFEILWGRRYSAFQHSSPLK